jgi:DNA-binding MarR family transcriptional regulator
MPRLLDATETARWTAWKRAADVVMEAVAREIADASGLSAADFAVLTRLVELGAGSLRQQELARLLGWERSRLSRQISRMTDRGLVTAERSGSARLISATDQGRTAVIAARPAHATAVRRVLLDQIDSEPAAEFWQRIEIVGTPDQTGPHTTH